MESLFQDLPCDAQNAVVRLVLKLLSSQQSDRYRYMSSEAQPGNIYAVVNFGYRFDPQLLPFPNGGELWLLFEIDVWNADYQDELEFAGVIPTLMRIELLQSVTPRRYLYASPLAIVRLAKELGLKDMWSQLSEKTLDKLITPSLLTELHADLAFDWEEDLENY